MKKAPLKLIPLDDFKKAVAVIAQVPKEAVQEPKRQTKAKQPKRKRSVRRRAS